MSLTCPKCQGSMRSYERNGVTVDQCTECRGIFLDRGELDHLVDAEARWQGGARGASGQAAGAGPASPAPAPVPPSAPGYGAGAPGHAGAYGQAAHAPGQHAAAASGHAQHGMGSGSGGLGAAVGEVLRQAGQARSGRSSQGYEQSRGQQGQKRKKSFLDELFG